mgnify:CR=1 FL=1
MVAPDGLVSQVPAFLISLAAGLLVTRNTTATNLPNEFVRQLLSRPQTLVVSAAFLGALVFTPHPATRLISSAHPAVTIFAMNRGVGPVGRVENRPEDGLITRLDDEVTIRLLPPGNFVFLEALLGGRTLAAAAGAALTAEPAFDLTGAIGGTIAAGAFSHAETETSDVEPA